MARNNNNNKLKAFVRFDGSGRIVPSSLIVQAFKPKVGNWKEIDAKECCNYVAPTTTSTTTVAPITTTTTTATPSTTTTTTVSVSEESAVGSFNSFDACAGTGTVVFVYYNNSTPLGVGSALYLDAGLTIPYNPGVFPSGNGTYLRIYFAAEDQICTMSGNIIQSYVACSSVTTTTTTTELLLQVRWQRADSGNACPSTNYIYLTGSPDFCSATDFYGDFSSIISSGTSPGAFVNIAGLSNGQYRTCQLVDSTHLTAFGTVACFNC